MDMNDLFQMLAEEKAKNSAEQKKIKKKSKDLQGDFLEAFSSELKQLKEQEEKQKREVAAMEAWLTSPTEKKDETIELVVEETDEPVTEVTDVAEEELEAVEQVFTEDEQILERIADTPLQEQALDYLKTKRVELSEEQVKIKGLEKQIDDVKKSITSIRLGLQGSSGGGAVKIKDMDDLDRSTALVNNKFLKYDSATGKFVGADASGGGGVDLSSVGEHILPSTTETYDLGSATKRWRDLYLEGQTINLGGTKIQKNSDGDVTFKDSSDNLKKVIVDELHIGNGGNVLKLKSSGGKLKAVDNSNAKISHDVAFSEISSTPTTLSGYGITDAQSALVSGTSIKTINGSSLLGSGDISITAGGGDVAFADITSKPTTLAGYGITDAFDGAYSSLSGTPTLFDGAYSSLSGTPTLFDGAYSSLTGTPTIPTVDSTSVTAAGALMDSEVTNLAEVKAFDSSDYATAAQGTNADTAHGWGNHASAGYLTSVTTSTTQTTGDNTTKIATTAFVQQEINALKALLYSYDQS
jgi:hypothetical protein